MVLRRQTSCAYLGQVGVGMKPSQWVIAGDKGAKKFRTDKKAGKSAGSHSTCFRCSSHWGATTQCCECAVGSWAAR